MRISRLRQRLGNHHSPQHSQPSTAFNSRRLLPLFTQHTQLETQKGNIDALGMNRERREESKHCIVE